MRRSPATCGCGTPCGIQARPKPANAALPIGYARSTSQVHHFFRSAESYVSVTKWTEQITLGFTYIGCDAASIQPPKMGRPVLSRRVPVDVTTEELYDEDLRYVPVKRTVSGANTRDIAEAARILVEANFRLSLSDKACSMPKLRMN